MKRGRSSGGSVTGGTGDVKPQILTLAANATASDIYAVNIITLPVPRFGAQKNKSTITEILWIDYYLNPENSADTTATIWAWLSNAVTRNSGDTSTLALSVDDIGDPRVIAPVIRNIVTTTSGSIVVQQPIRVDLTDSNGNGILFAADRIYLTMGTTSSAETTPSVIGKMAYRLVNVGLEEYVGILASQQ